MRLRIWTWLRTCSSQSSCATGPFSSKRCLAHYQKVRTAGLICAIDCGNHCVSLIEAVIFSVDELCSIMLSVLYCSAILLRSCSNVIRIVCAAAELATSVEIKRGEPPAFATAVRDELIYFMLANRKRGTYTDAHPTASAADASSDIDLQLPPTQGRRCPSRKKRLQCYLLHMITFAAVLNCNLFRRQLEH